MGSYENSAIVDNPSGGSVIEQHICSNFPVHNSCSEVAYNVLDSNLHHSNVPETCMDFPKGDYNGFLSSDHPKEFSIASKDGFVYESENADNMAFEKMLISECGICLSGHCSHISGCHLESDELFFEKGQSRGEDDHAVDSVFTFVDDSAKCCTQDGEQNHDKSNTDSTAGWSLAVSEKKSEGVTDLLTDSCNQISQGFQIPLEEAVPISSFPVYCPQQNEPEEDVKRSADPLLNDVNKSDSLNGTEADTFKETYSSQDCEVPSKLLYREAGSDFYLLPHKNDCKSRDSPYEERDIDIVDIESKNHLHIQVLPSHECQRTLRDSFLVDSPSKCVQQVRSDDIDPFAENVADIMEHNVHVTEDTSTDSKSNILPEEDNTCELKDGSLESAGNCSYEESISPLFCLPSLAFTSNSSFEDVPDLLAKDDTGSRGSNCVVGKSGQTDNEGKDDVKFDCVTETKCPVIGSSSSRRNSRRNKSSHKTQMKKSARKQNNKAEVPHPCDLKINFNAARRKRSCSSKPPRSSIWGLFGDIVFEQSSGVGANHFVCHEHGEARGSRGSGKRNMNNASSSSAGSMNNHCAPTTRVRLRVKLGKEIGQSYVNILVPKVVDAVPTNSETGLVTQKVASIVEDKCGDEGAVVKFGSSKGMEEGASVLNGKLANNYIESIMEKSGEDAEVLCPADNSTGVVEAIDNKDMDSGTSPDSEVINLVPDVPVGERHEDAHDLVLPFPNGFTSVADVTISKRGKSKDHLHHADDCILEGGSPGQQLVSKAKPSKKHGRRKNMNNEHCMESFTSSTDVNTLSNLSSSKALIMEPLFLSGEIEIGASTEALKFESGADAKTTSSLDLGYGSSDLQDSKNLLAPARSMGRKLPKNITSKRAPKGKSKKKRGTACKEMEKQQKSVNKTELIGKGVADKIVCKVGNHLDRGNSAVGNDLADNIGKTDTANISAFQEVSYLDIVAGDGLGEQLPVPPRNAWVRCDDCHKWRRILADLADLIEETNCTWTCKDSKDTAFSHCSIPQEKSNAEINAELGLSDASGEEDAYDVCKNCNALEYKRPIVSQESTFTRILTNEFLHRNCKTQTIDEVMVCHCKPPPNGQLGCRDECLNRMLNIECVQGTCPCGALCSNQQFQKRNYAELLWFRCGKKGYGLRSVEDISKGQFLIEYVGEVLDMHAHETRQREYALKGHKHFYFMTLNGSEVIDASAKGNLGRFINHSCEPNCRTEKWMVNGEICIGLFAMRDIKKGEEVTFDYNYVRVLGAAAKKCYCGAPQCRGYIGGDPLKTEVIVQGDSDEEFPEPVMLTEEGEIGDGMPRTNYFDGVKMPTTRHISIDSGRLDKSITTAEKLESSTEKENSRNRTSAVSQLNSSKMELIDPKSKLQSSVQVEEISYQTEDVTSKPMPSVRQDRLIEEEISNTTSCSIERSEISSPTATRGKVLSHTIDIVRVSKSETVEDKKGTSKTLPRMKTSRSTGSVKNGKVRTNPPSAHKTQVTANRSHVLSMKPKKAVEGVSIGRFEAVQEKLTELLDGDGGISKRKDSAKGYLKLLLLTAASGDSGNGEAIQSNRDLSMILDALLKTKSRAVLIDVINKNGLRMLHNIMKQYRRDFKKIPILRKLLKVLEYLAVHKILTCDHINDDAPCHGMESFRDSILSFTEHDDKQVHQIARSFRDRWIPRHVRKLGFVDRGDGRVEFQRGSNKNRFSSSHNHRQDQDARPTEAIDCVKQPGSVTNSMGAGPQESCPAPSVGGSHTSGTKRRKRKSRWDQPAETNIDSSHSRKEQKVDLGQLDQVVSSLLHGSGEVCPGDRVVISRENSHSSGCVHDHWQQDPAIQSDEERHNIHEDVPPGFSSPLHHCLGSLNDSSNSGDLPQQNAFHSECPDAVIGHPQEKFISRLPVSYGIPFTVVQQYGTSHAEIAGSWITAPGMPFSPFPPLPPYPNNKKDPPPHPINAVTVMQPAEVGQWDTCGAAGCYLDGTTSSTTGVKRVKGTSHDLGRRYFRQQKWCNTKLDRSCPQ
ncbi:Histone-lysine N-methyltransferase ASHH2 [Quillaja saponaria]|uniref:Histone-lysine N-methyltransferase ASHH2 n=1 Tax=Quillaja saponaria TaxID=32244 RepID=A0AAD7LW90_QUISA|nr:Histone-lysine N-methyltransferase ASHH2 [Quillaja saponaria]